LLAAAEFCRAGILGQASEIIDVIRDFWTFSEISALMIDNSVHDGQIILFIDYEDAI